MNTRLRDAGLAALLVLTIVLVGFALRSPSPPDTGVTAEPPVSQPSASPTPTAQESVEPTPSPSPSASPSITPTPAPVNALFLGDSFAAGKGASAPEKRFSTLLSTEFDWIEDNRAHPGTGYLKQSASNACDGAPCKPFSAQLSGLADSPPTIVVITGGANDAGLPASEVKAAVEATLRDLQAAAPAAKVFVVNPLWDGRALPQGFAQRTATIAEVARSAGATFLDIGQPLHDNPALLANGEANDAGHARLAELLSTQLASALQG